MLTNLNYFLLLPLLTFASIAFCYFFYFFNSVVEEDDPNILTIDVVPSNYANFYTYPSNYVPSTQYRQRNVAPPPEDLRQRMCTMALSVLRHAEVAHDVRMVHVVFEMIVARNPSTMKKSKSKRRHSRKGRGSSSSSGSNDKGGGVDTARRVQVYVTGAAEVHWIMAPGGWRTLRAAPTIVKGKGTEAKMEADIAFEACGFGNGKQKMTRPESAPDLAFSLNVRRQARVHHSQSSGQLLSTSMQLFQPTMHTASGSNLAGKYFKKSV